MRAAFVPTPTRPRRLARRDVVGNGGPRAGRRLLLPRLGELVRQHPSEDQLPFEERVIYRLVSGGNPHV